MLVRMTTILLCVLLVPRLGAQALDARPATIVEKMGSEAKSLAPLVKSDLGRGFLAATALLPPGQARVVYVDPDTRQTFSAEEAERRPEEARKAWRRMELSEDQFYTTKYGTPMAYCRALDLVGQAGLDDVRGRRVLDFGYGTIGHLRLMALEGAQAVGVDVDSFLVALYSHREDQGPVQTRQGPKGSVRLVDGFWPSHEGPRKAVGGKFDLFVSKNTLKRGYIHPEREADPRTQIQLGVDDETFLRHLHGILVPGGFAIIYNLSPKQNPPEEKFIPWADGRCPFAKELWAKVGFEIIAFDADDSETARSMGRALGWDQGSRPMNLEENLFAHYTLARKRA